MARAGSADSDTSAGSGTSAKLSPVKRQLLRFETRPKRGRQSGERETAQILAQVAEAESTALGLRDRGPELRQHPLTTPEF